MLNNTLIGVDLGGTKIYSGLITGEKVVKEQKLPTPTNTKDAVAAIAGAIKKVYTDGVEGIGIGAPGLIDFSTGTILAANNLKFLEGISIKKAMEEEFGIPVFVNNDANCFVLGEKHFGSGKGYDDVVGLTLGTGLGGGVVINGKLHTGKNAGAAEFGEIKYKDQTQEYYCSSQFFKNVYNTTGLEVFEKAKAGDNGALKIFNELGTNIGEAIYTILAMYDPQVVVIGGSIAGSKEFIVDAIHNVLKSFHSKQAVENLKLEFSTESHVTVLGAAALFYNNKG
ncbi:MAG: ROK family protein [Bacteroidota bacterium]